MSTIARRLAPIAGILLALACTARSLAAEPAPGSKPDYRGSIDTDFGYVPGSTLHYGGTDVGKLSTTHSRLRYTGTFVSGGDVDWTMGLEYSRLDFGVPKGQPLPPSLGAATIPLGVRWKISDRWSFRGEVAPGVYSDFQDIEGSDFNAPITAGLSYAINDGLVVSLQVSIDARRDIPVIGGPGVWWRISPRWTLSLLLPRPRLEFHHSDSWTFFVGGEIAGGAYQLGSNSGTKRGAPSMDSVNISYREIRGGIGADWKIGHGFFLEAAGGWMFDRRFVVDDLRRTWNGNGAPYGRVQLSYRY